MTIETKKWPPAEDMEEFVDSLRDTPEGRAIDNAYRLLNIEYFPDGNAPFCQYCRLQHPTLIRMAAQKAMRAFADSELTRLRESISDREKLAKVVCSAYTGAPEGVWKNISTDRKSDFFAVADAVRAYLLEDK